MSVSSESMVFNREVRKHYMSLDQDGACQVMYVWLDKTGKTLLCKSRTLSKDPDRIEDIPVWNSAWTLDKVVYETFLMPVRMFRDPFNFDPNKLVLCEVLDCDYKPAVNNRRSKCDEVLKERIEFQPWFGMEQRYALFDLDGNTLAWSPQTSKASSALETEMVYGRDISKYHVKACQYAGVKICVMASESLLSQSRFRIYPGERTEMADHLWMARFILHRVCEEFGVVASFGAGQSDKNNSTTGCTVTFSTEKMRSEGGLRHIEEAVRKLGNANSVDDNVNNLIGQFKASGLHDSSPLTVGCHIPEHIRQRGCGYLQDWCPVANCDPYVVIRHLLERCLSETND